MIYGGKARMPSGVVSALGIALAFAGGACGGTSNNPNGISTGGTSGGGRGGGMSAAGRGGSMSSGGDAGSADAGEEGGSAGSSMGGMATGGSSGSGQQLPADCPEINPIPVPGQLLVLRSLRFEPGEFVLQNVSDEPVTITGGRQGWQWCQFPAYWNLSEEEDVVIEPGESRAFAMVYNLGYRDMEPEGGEMGIYTSPGSFTTASLMRAFVSWGEVLPQREPTAVAGGYWVFDERVEVGPTDAGFVIVGESNRASGYQGVRAACLEPPPTSD
jgi:hypothetical protein